MHGSSSHPERVPEEVPDVRLGATVVAMQVLALVLAVWAFGLPAVVIGVPLLLGTVVVLVTVGVASGPLRVLQRRRATRWEHDTPAQGGLMSGFFELPAARP